MKETEVPPVHVAILVANVSYVVKTMMVAVTAVLVRPMGLYPEDTRRNDNVIFTSKRCRNIVLIQ